jgi:hypothetical protein
LSAYGIIWWQIVFTPDNAVRPYSELEYNYLVTTASGYERFTQFYDPTSIESNSTVSFIVEFSNPNLVDVNVKLKFGVKSVDTGTITSSIVKQE